MTKIWYLVPSYPGRITNYVLRFFFIIVLFPLAAISGIEKKPSYIFTIPAQPLGMALEQFSKETGLAVLLDSRYSDRPSQGLMGRFPPDNALNYLLQDTGLYARWYEASRAYSVLQKSDTETDRNLSATTQMAGVLLKNERYLIYAGILQERLLKRLCQSPWTRHGYYRLAMQLWIGKHGEVSRAHMLGSTGDRQRDEDVQHLMRGFQTGMLPAEGMPQPVTILLQTDQVNSEQLCTDPDKTGG